MCKLCWALLVAAIVVMLGAIVIIATGNKTSEGSDGRQVIQLEPGQRDLVLAEMRVFVESIRDVTQALGANDKAQFEKAALRVGLAAQEGIPLDLMKALPLPFKKLGMETHKKFDQLADSAAQGADNAVLLTELSQLMNNCVACHAAYQIQPSQP